APSPPARGSPGPGSGSGDARSGRQAGAPLGFEPVELGAGLGRLRLLGVDFRRQRGSVIARLPGEDLQPLCTLHRRLAVPDPLTDAQPSGSLPALILIHRDPPARPIVGSDGTFPRFNAKARRTPPAAGQPAVDHARIGKPAAAYRRSSLWTSRAIFRPE